MDNSPASLQPQVYTVVPAEQPPTSPSTSTTSAQSRNLTLSNMSNRFQSKVKKLTHHSSSSTEEKIKKDPDVIAKLSLKTLENLPDKALNDLPINRLHHLPSEILERVSNSRIGMMSCDGLVALAKKPQRLTVVLKKAPHLSLHLTDDMIKTFPDNTKQVVVKYRRIAQPMVDNTPNKALDNQVSPPPPPRSLPTPGPSAGSPYLSLSLPQEPLSQSLSPMGNNGQAGWQQSNPNSTSQSPPPGVVLPRTSSYPQTGPYPQPHRNQSLSSSPGSSVQPTTPYVPLRYTTPAPQPHVGAPPQPAGSPASQPVALSRSSSPPRYQPSAVPPYVDMSSYWDPVNGAPSHHPEFKVLPALPGQNPEFQSFQTHQSAQIQTLRGLNETLFPIQSPELPGLQAQQVLQSQGDSTKPQTQATTVRELELQVENLGKEKETLSQQVAALTASLAAEKERLESERQSTNTLNQSIGRLEGDKERLQSEKQDLEIQKQRLVTQNEVAEREKTNFKEKQMRLEESITSYLTRKKWKGLRHGPKNHIDMLFDFCNEQVVLAVENQECYNEEKEITARLESEKQSLAQKLQVQKDWYMKYMELDTRLQEIHSEHQRQFEAEKRHHQEQVELERRHHQQKLEAEQNKHQAETQDLRNRLDNHEAYHNAEMAKLRVLLEGEKQNLRDEIDELEREKNNMRTQYQSTYDGYKAKIESLKGEHEAALSQQSVAHQQELQAFHEHCQGLINKVAAQYELNQNQAVKELKNKVRLLESSLVDNSDDYRPATDDHLQVDFDQINLDIGKITHNLPTVDFSQISHLDSSGFLEREGRDQLRFLLQSIIWGDLKSGFFSSPFGLGALGPRDGKRRLLELWIAYRKLLGNGTSDVHLPIGEYDMPAIEQGYIEFLQQDKETNKWRSSTFQAVMAALLPKKGKENSALTEYLSSPFFHNRNHVLENILTTLRRICGGGIPQAIEQTVQEMVFRASELALQFGMQRAELGLDMPERNALVPIGQAFVICYDNDAEHGMQKSVFLGVSPICYKTGDGRNDITTTKVISPGHIYPYSH